ncbi:MAG: CHAT domain-containing tetratricopeptide repeat protein [Acidobacteriota bacterium]
MPVPQDDLLLELNKPVEREIAADEVHTYRIRLTAGQFAHLQFFDLLLGVIAFAPDGKQIIEIGRLEGSFAVHPLSLVAEVSGDYRIEVRPLEKKPGRYRLVIEELRQAMPQDRSRALTEAAFTKAELLRRRGRKEDLRLAVEILRTSLPDWRASRIALAEADTLNLMGMIHRRLGESSQALEQYRQAFEVFQRENYNIGQALVLGNIGVVHSEAGDKVTALRTYLQATQQWREINAPIGLGIALTNLGSAYGAVGEMRKGVEALDEAMKIWEGVNNRNWKSGVLRKLGVLYQYLGEPEIAADYCQQSLQLWLESDGPYEKAQSLMCVGSAQGVLGNYPKAIEHQTEAIKLCRETGNSNCEGTALSGLGLIHTMAKDYRRAIECFQLAIVISQSSKNSYNEAKHLHGLGATYLLLGDLPAAERFLLQSLQLQQSVGDRQGEAFVGAFLARVYRQQGRLSESLDSLQKALAIIEQQRQSLSGHSSQTSYFGRLHSHHEFYLDLLMQLHRESPTAGHAVTAFQASERARARTLLEALSQVRSDIRQGVDPELLERETALRQQLYSKEQALTQLLSDKHSAEQTAGAKKEIENLLNQQREVAALIRANSPRYAALTQAEPLSLKQVQELLGDDTVLLEYALGEERSHLFAVTKTSFDVYELPKRAEVESLAKQFYDIAAHRSPDFTVAEEWLAEAEKQYPAIAARLSQMILQPAAAQLGKKRVMIVAEGILQYIPFAALPVAGKNSETNRFPTTDYRLLIQDHEIVSLPSASVLAVLRREVGERQSAAKALAVLGDPVFSKQDERVVADAKTAEAEPAKPKLDSPGSIKALRQHLRRGTGNLAELSNLSRLRHTRQEATAIAVLVAADSRLLALDFDASRELALSGQLSQYRIVHFATHGLLDSATPDFSAVVLSLVGKDGKPQNGSLRLHEIYNLNLPAELVVLSACETGLGKDIKGEGLISLTRGFMYAGARRVLVSLWPVDDPATAELMKRFYRGMLKENLTPSAALKKAQTEMRKQPRWRSPFYWAGFVLQGEW